VFRRAVAKNQRAKTKFKRLIPAQRSASGLIVQLHGFCHRTTVFFADGLQPPSSSSKEGFHRAAAKLIK